ncbi:hypothetical protein J6590_020300 [Homalodisca vitripennis]|nr:hypothetical protein J6590_020300 [Homalodisca vitripennis]
MESTMIEYRARSGLEYHNSPLGGTTMAECNDYNNHQRHEVYSNPGTPPTLISIVSPQPIKVLIDNRRQQQHSSVAQKELDMRSRLETSSIFILDMSLAQRVLSKKWKWAVHEGLKGLHSRNTQSGAGPSRRRSVAWRRVGQVVLCPSDPLPWTSLSVSSRTARFIILAASSLIICSRNRTECISQSAVVRSARQL